MLPLRARSTARRRINLNFIDTESSICRERAAVNRRPEVAVTHNVPVAHNVPVQPAEHGSLAADWEPRGEADCRVRTIMDRVGDKWSVAVVTELTAGPRRFSELKRALPGINQRMLTSTLRVLERDGLVTRTVYPQVPPRVDYELTGLG
ncbi:Transcriptional regulator, HxlR family [Parafrankia sp. Ea1.12]|nr:Transcriptional regulator, HxlR family [Parafrankia sp. Ea1.12]